MSPSPSPVVLVDGREPSIAQLAQPALVNYGHFTAMQVRGGATRGLDLHLHRLESAHAELFRSVLDLETVRRHMHTAVITHPDADLRVTLYESELGTPRVMTAVRPPMEPALTPQSLVPVRYQRPFAHIKHVGSFAQIRYGKQAKQQGYDDAILIGPNGHISETTIANVGFFEGDQVVWPAGPSLRGVTWQLIDQALQDGGTPGRHHEVTEQSAGRFSGAFTANSRGLSPVGRLGEHYFPTESRAFTRLSELYASLPWQRVKARRIAPPGVSAASAKPFEGCRPLR